MHNPTFKSLEEIFSLRPTQTTAQQSAPPTASEIIVALVAEAKAVLAKLEEAAATLGAAPPPATALTSTTIDGVFDGKHMITDDGVIHPVSENYASKSKLVEGDMLQMIAHTDGRRYFKQISRVARATVTAILECIDQNSGIAAASNGTRYHILHAPLRFFRVTPGDTITLEIPVDGGTWAAIVGKAGACYTESRYASPLPHA